MQIKSKQPDLSLSIFAVMSALANEYEAINLSQGFPDFDTHPRLVELVNRFMKSGNNQYAPMPGVMALRQALTEKTAECYGAFYNPESEITITAGATEALYAAITAIVRPGDEVIVFEPFYDAYVPVVHYSGGIPIYIKMKHPDYHIDWVEVKKAITPQTRMIILNSPHNPSGAVLPESDMQLLTELIRRTNIILLSDEVYEHIIFDGGEHQSLCRYPELAERSFIVSSLGKTYHTTGWKIGYCLAPKEMTAELRKIHQFITFAVNTPIQMAYAEFLQEKELYREVSRFYQTKRDVFKELMARTRFKLLPCAGTYFQLADYSAISDETEIDFAIRLIKEHGVASVPVSSFYAQHDENHVLRFCFAKKNETLTRAAERLCRI